MAFQALWQEIRKDCGWEHIPREKIPMLHPLLNDAHIATMMEALNVFDDDFMEDDAGDMADEQWRLATFIVEALSTAPYPVEAALEKARATAIEDTQEVIDRILKKRQ